MRKRAKRTYKRCDSASAKARLFAKCEVVTETGCWIFTGATVTNRNDEQYGQIRLHGRLTLAHRATIMLHHGIDPIPAGMVGAHKCNTSLCCNPDHLAVQSQSENMKYWASQQYRSEDAGKGQAKTTVQCWHCHDAGCIHCDGVPF